MDVTAAQAAISGLFDRPLNGHRLTAEDVAAVFGRLGGHIPAGLSGAITAIHDAATRAVGASEVAVTDILNEKKVADALSAVSTFVRGCAPATG